ncbi:MAG TPA: class I SAM-dependent methyltransferase [Gemmatimonadaceae bacterium]
MLSVDRAREIYDRIGAWQDTQQFYESAAVNSMVAHGDFGTAQSVFELGCGTGRIAEQLLAGHLPPTARYHGVDLSSTMVRLASSRLARFGSRATVFLSSGSVVIAAEARSLDRCVSTYVLDLLPDDAIRQFFSESRRVLVPGGRLCLTSLAPGQRGVSRVVSTVWSRVQALAPNLVGGCRPIDLSEYLSSAWSVTCSELVVAWGVASQVLVATPCDEKLGANTTFSDPSK